MAIRFTLPTGGSGDIKDLVFSILADEHPLKLIELTNLIKRRYGRPVTFQGVRKAVLQLVEEGVLERRGNEFEISRAWVQESKRFLDGLYLKLVEKKGAATRRRHDSLGGDVSVFTFGSVNEMMRAWEDISDGWYRGFRKGEYGVNCYQAAHSWEVLLHPDIETKLMGGAVRRGVRAYILCTENTPLDRSLARFHERLGVRFVINPSLSSFDKSYYVGTYGPLIIQAKYPAKIVKRLDAFFRKSKDIDGLDLAELSGIANAKAEVKMTVIRNLEMAKQINASAFARMGIEE